MSIELPEKWTVKIRATGLAMMMVCFTAAVFCADENGRELKPKDAPSERVVIDEIDGAASQNLIIGPRKKIKRDPAKETAEHVKKMQDDIRANPTMHGCFGSVWGDGSGVSHLVECIDGYVVEREYYSNACGSQTKGLETDPSKTVTTITGDKGRLLETITWSLARTIKTATITDASGKVIKVITF